MLVQDILEYRAREQADSPALRDGARTWTYAELEALAESVADALVAAGIGHGDRVAVLADNCLEYFAWYFGAAKVGAVTVPLNQRLAPPEWAYILDDAAARLVIARGARVAALDAVRAELTGVETFVAADAAQDGWEDLDGWLQRAPRRSRTGGVHPDDPFVQMYTSGTTGRPKGAIISHRALVDSLWQGLIAVNPGDAARIHLAMPVSHMGSTSNALLIMLGGGSVYLQQAFDPHESVRIIDEEGITYSVLVPAMIQAILVNVPDVTDRTFPDLRLIGYGAAPIAPHTLRRAMEVFNCDFFQGFGQTEASGSVTYLTQADHRRAARGDEHLLTSAGRPAIGTEVRVVDPDGNDCAPGEVGEIVMRGPQQMSGYWNLPEETAKALRDGWLHMGDAGTLNEEGYLYIKDRIKDMIVTGGENVYPAEVERVLFEHDAVADAAVIGVPDERWGEVAKAFVVLKPGAAASDEELIAFCKSQIAGFKVPKTVSFLDKLPRNASGKVLKYELRAPFWDAHGRGVA
ncbi:MAG: long-chain-fatty-acid--CoA ligase [Acidimicrobiia bacterium]